MGWILLFIFAASVPVFYIYGLISFFTRKKPQKDIFEETLDRKKILKEIITDLEIHTSKNPSKKISQLLKEYKEDYAKLEDGATITFADAEVIKNDDKQRNDDIGKNDVSTIWEHWYSENSINLLLYIGAFLIVASASIFVGLGWQTFSGLFKSSFITVMTLAFFAFGTWFYYKPKIRNAGVTFTTISALLIPFCSIAWYNFVLKDQGVTFGIVWAITSIFLIGFYTFLAFWQKNNFYAYTSCLSVVSFMLSLVQVYELDTDFYILNAIISGYVMFGARLLLKRSKNNEFAKFAQALEITENVVLPTALIYGFAVAMSENKIFTFEATLSAFLVTVYYFFSYLLTKKPVLLILSAVLFPITISLFYRWQGFPGEYLAYTLDFVGLFYLVFAYIFNRYKKFQEQDINLILSTLLTILVFIFSYIAGFDKLDLFILSLAPIVSSVTATIIKNDAKNILISSVFSGIATFILVNDIFVFENQRLALSLAFLILTSLYFGFAVYFKKNTKYLSVFTLTLFIYSGLGLLFALDNSLYLFAESLYLACLAMISVFVFSKPDLAYLSNGLLFLTLWNFLRFVNSPLEYYPFYFSALSSGMYLISQFIDNDVTERFKRSGLAGLVMSPFVLGFWSQTMIFDFSTSKYKALEQNSLLISYISLMIFGWETAKSKSWDIGYFTSALGIVTILWQFKVLELDNIQYYSLPLAIYFMALAYTRKIKSDPEKQNVLDFTAMVILILPTMVQAFSSGGAKYALLLGLEGITLLTLGISWQYKLYRFASILAIVLAVLSQSYEYVFALPRWIITGIAGLIFLIVAITLLLKRKDPQN